MKGTISIEQQLKDLPKLDRVTLQDHYQRLYKKELTQNCTDDFLRVSITCRLQQQLIARFRSRMYHALTAAEAITSLVIEASSNTILLGQWNETVCEVTVLEEGAIYQGNYYDSVQAVVDVITGGKKSLAEFFGPRNRVPRHGD